MTDSAATVRVLCGACEGEGTTLGYPNQTPTDDPGRYTCWACSGEKFREATLAPGEREKIVRQAVEALTFPERGDIAAGFAIAPFDVHRLLDRLGCLGCALPAAYPPEPGT